MATFEQPEVFAVLRQRGRDWMEEAEPLFRELAATMRMEARVEFGAAVAELRRLLHADAPPPALEVPANVRRLVAKGATGPAFGARGGVEFAVGDGALRMPARDLLDVDATFDSTPSTADSFAAAHDLPTDGPEQFAVQNEERK